MANTQRDLIKELMPPWLATGTSEKVGYSVGLVQDAIVDMAASAVKAKFPGVYSPESLPLIGRERRIRRGLTETDTTYALRLPRWLTDHKTRGGPYAMLAQLFAFYAPNNFPIRLVYRSGRAFDMDTSGNVTMSDVSWTPDATPEKWAQWWLIFQWPTAVPAAPAWGAPGLAWGAFAWGTGFTPAQVSDLRTVPAEWNAGHALGRVIVQNGGKFWGQPGLTWGAFSWGGDAPANISVE
jgi:hypothetical protein